MNITLRNRLMWHIKRALLMTALSLGAPQLSSAQPKSPTRVTQQKQGFVSPSSRLRARAAKARKSANAQPKQNTSQNAGGGKVIEFKQLSVEGTVQRPSASYFLQRRKLKFRGIEPRKSFIPEILTSVKRYPF